MIIWAFGSAIPMNLKESMPSSIQNHFQYSLIVYSSLGTRINAFKKNCWAMAYLWVLLSHYVDDVINIPSNGDAKNHHYILYPQNK